MIEYKQIQIIAFISTLPLLFFGGIAMFFVYDSGWWLLASVAALILISAG